VALEKASTAENVRKNKEITELNKKQVIMNRTNFEWDDITYSEHLARATLSGVNAEKGAWVQFQTMENRNNQKRRSLRKLARVGCDMGGKAWTPQCDALNAFYAEQDGEIKDIKINYEAMFEDYRWALKSKAYMASVHKETFDRIAATEKYSQTRQKAIRQYWSGESLTRALARESGRVARQNRRYKQKLYNLRQRQTYVLRQQRNLNKQVEGEITQLRNRGK